MIFFKNKERNLTVAIKIKYLRICLTRKRNVLYNENCKALVKEIKNAKIVKTFHIYGLEE